MPAEPVSRRNGPTISSLVITYLNARTADPVCHWGITSGEVCGHVTAATPPLITVTQTGDHGDSGGPTYIRINDTTAAAVGLWQGHTGDVGYAMSLPAALDSFRHTGT